MKSKLNNSQIEYIFHHLNHHFEFSDGIRKKICFDENLVNLKSQIVFNLSSTSLADVKYINDIPILFPLNDNKYFYSIDKNNNLIFNNDLLKSSFFLLSGYQETQNHSTDKYDRFQYKDSIQCKLNIATFPLVNFYFDKILEGIQKFCEINAITFKKRKFWDNSSFGFLLTHDVDRVDKYTFGQIKYSIKQLLGISPSNRRKKEDFKNFLLNTIKFFSKENPYWNFDWLKSLEDKYGFNSVWFFLPQGDKNIDAHFSFNEYRIRELITNFKKNGDEIGLHGTYNSFENKAVLDQDYNSVKELIEENPAGNRQHWLRFKYPQTLRNLEDVGLLYDSTWAFHDHVGWRNSYCLPFRPYDIEQDRMMNIWEFPLTVMDVTLFEYQNLDQKLALKKIDEILETTEQFRGMFTLLWHNSQVNLTSGENLKDFYITVLENIKIRKPKSILPSSFIKEFE